MAVYAASKALLQAFSLALSAELADEKRRGGGAAAAGAVAGGELIVQTLVPGPTDTEIDRDCTYAVDVGPRATPEAVVKASLEKLFRRRPLTSNIKGLYRQRFLTGIAPQRMLGRAVAKMFGPPPAEAQPVRALSAAMREGSLPASRPASASVSESASAPASVALAMASATGGRR